MIINSRQIFTIECYFFKIALKVKKLEVVTLKVKKFKVVTLETRK